MNDAIIDNEMTFNTFGNRFNYNIKRVRSLNGLDLISLKKTVQMFYLKTIQMFVCDLFHLQLSKAFYRKHSGLGSN